MDNGLEAVEPQLEPGKKLHITVMHDETIIRANELHRRVYLCNGRMPL